VFRIVHAVNTAFFRHTIAVNQCALIVADVTYVKRGSGQALVTTLHYNATSVRVPVSHCFSYCCLMPSVGVTSSSEAVKW
jgi:hypothetical protein